MLRQVKNNIELLERKMQEEVERHGHKPVMISITFAWLEVIVKLLKHKLEDQT